MAQRSVKHSAGLILGCNRPLLMGQGDIYFTIRNIFIFCFLRMIVLFIFRLLPIETVGEQIFDGYLEVENDSENFECSTTQPSCRQQCYNRFHPISHCRLWELQILIIALPILIRIHNRAKMHLSWSWMSTVCLTANVLYFSSIVMRLLVRKPEELYRIIIQLSELSQEGAVF